MDSSIVILLIITILLLYFYIKNYSYWKLNKVNGPKPIPFVGTIMQVLIGKLSIGNYTKKIYDQYPDDRMVGVYAGTKKVLILRDLDLIRDVMMKDFSNFVDRGIGYHDKHEPLSANVGLVDEDRWRLLRRKLTPVFSSMKLKKMFNLLIGCTDPLIKHLTSVDGHVVDMRAVMERYAIDVIGVCVFGLKIDALFDDNNLFYKMGRRFFNPTLKNFIRLRLKSYMPFLYKFIGWWFTDWELQDFFITLTRDNIEHRKKSNENRNDFIDLLMALKENPQDYCDTAITDSVLAAQLFIFFIAGYETSASTVSNCMFELALNSEIQDKLRDEINCELISRNGNVTYDGIENMKYLDKVLCETLRKYPPGNFTQRRSTQSYKFSGTNLTIPKGTVIWIPIAGIHCNAEYYPNPNLFDPDRFKTEEINNRHQMSYLPFGAGPRNCLGLRFAKMQVKVAVTKLIQRFKVNVCDETDVNYTINEKSFLLAPLNGIRLKITKL